MKNSEYYYIVLLTLLSAGLAVTAYLCWEKKLYFSLIFCLACIISCCIALCIRQSRNNRMIASMLESIYHSDLSLSYSLKGKSASECQLAHQINNIVSDFRNRQNHLEQEFQYYETLLNTIDTLILVLGKNDRIYWMNRAAIKDLCGFRIHHLSELTALQSDFPSFLKTLRPGETQVITLKKEHTQQELAVSATEYSSSGMQLKLVNLKNIHSVLEIKEMESWQKLVRVLTHEIMNSITPVISLSDTLCERMQQNDFSETATSILLQGMQTIHRRSKGLLQFVENYRKLTRLPLPMRTSVKVSSLMCDIQKLYPQCNFRCHHLDTLLLIDRTQIEQVLINLIKNAQEACTKKEKPVICLEAFLEKNNTEYTIRITDNGTGILPEVTDKIFVPFFTTKTSGSGIGLSLCKQIINQHHGQLTVHSIPEEGSCFTLHLPLNC